MSIRRYGNLCATKAKSRLCWDPELWDRPVLENAKEKVENPEYPHEAHEYLKATDMPAEDSNAEKERGNGELYKRCG